MPIFIAYTIMEVKFFWSHDFFYLFSYRDKITFHVEINHETSRRPPPMFLLFT